MSGKTINEVVAENLTHWMAERGIKQAALAEKAGVDQKTISNYLHPKQRMEGSSGKEPSARLSELDKVAKALRVEVWQLTRHMTARQRALYDVLEKAYLQLQAVESASANSAAERAEIERKLIQDKPATHRRSKRA